MKGHAPLPEVRHVPFTAKQPEARLRPVPYREEVAAVQFAMPLKERSEPGLVVPTPTFPAFVMRIASVSAPPFRVKKARSPFPAPKFCWSIEPIAAVVVAVVTRP